VQTEEQQQNVIDAEVQTEEQQQNVIDAEVQTEESQNGCFRLFNISNINNNLVEVQAAVEEQPETAEADIEIVFEKIREK
jgi:hypothetical protein